MAGLANGRMGPPGVWTQIALVAELRGRVFRNTLRKARGRIELAARILLAALAGFGALGIGVVLGTLAYAGFATGRTRFFPMLMWAVFACWQVSPVVLAGFGIEFEFRGLLKFPLRFSTFAFLSLLYGVVDPPSVIALFWTLCILVGAFLARADLLAPTLVVLAVFSLMNLVLNRVLLAWLHGLLARRKTREALAAVVLLLAVALQLSLVLAERWETQIERGWRFVRPGVLALPPEVASRSLVAAVQGRREATWNGSVLLSLYFLGGSLLLGRRLRAQYRGEDVREDVAEARRKGSLVAPGWHLPGVSERVAAICEKELRYTLRNGQAWLSLVMPLMMVVFFSLVWQMPRNRPDVLLRAPELFFPAAVAYGLLILAPLVHNAFAFEGRGIQLLFAAPARFQEILLAKNLVHGLMIAATAWSTWVLVSLLQVPPRAGVAAMTFAGLLLATLAHFMIGNALSLYFPRQIEFGHFRKRASEMNVLSGFFSQMVVLGILVAIALQVRRAAPGHWEWVAAGVYLAASFATAWLYRTSLDWSARLAIEQSEKLTEELCR